MEHASLRQPVKERRKVGAEDVVRIGAVARRGDAVDVEELIRAEGLHGALHTALRDTLLASRDKLLCALM
jgi:hypothetical protein